MWGADWKFRHEGNFSSSWGLTSDAEQLSRVKEFSIPTNSRYRFFFLHNLPLTTATAFRLEFVLFYQFHPRITAFFKQEMFRTFGAKWCRKWCQYRRPDIMHKVVLQDRNTQNVWKLWKTLSGMQEKVIKLVQFESKCMECKCTDPLVKFTRKCHFCWMLMVEHILLWSCWLCKPK